MVDAAAAAAASAAWLAQNHPDWGQQSTSAAQAAQINAAYLANQLPVLPQYATGGGARYTAAEIADAQAEAAKYAYFNAPIDYSKYANVPLSQMPANVASRVQDYYAAHPSAAAQAITAQYAAQQNRVVSTGTEAGTSVYQAGVGWTQLGTEEAKGTAAREIAREVGRTGGAVDVGLGLKAIAEGAKPSEVYFATGAYITRPSFQSEVLTTKEGQHFVNKAWEGAPIRLNVSGAEIATGGYTGPIETGIHTARGDWGGLYTTGATKAAESNIPTTIRGEKTVAAFADYGLTVVNNKDQLKNALVTYVPYGSYTQEELQNTKLTISKETGEVAIYQYNPERQQWGLIGGGGRNALQSGMFSVGKSLTAFVTEQGAAGTYVTPEGSGLSRLGAESTGGAVRPLSEVSLLAPNEAVSRYFGAYGKYNLANFADQVAGGKAEAPGAKIRYTLAEGSTAPSIQYMGPEGVIKGETVTSVTGQTINQILGTDRLVGSKIVGGEAKVSAIPSAPAVSGELPSPYISASTGTIAPKGDIFGITIPYVKDVVAFFQPGKEVSIQPSVSVLPTTTTLVGTSVTGLPETKTLIGTEVTKDAAGNEITTKTYQVTGGTETTKEYLTTGGRTVTTTTFEKSTPSAWDRWLTGAEKTTADVTGISRLPTPTTEQIKSQAPIIALLPGATTIGMALMTPGTSEYAASFIRGEAVQAQTKPLETAISYGVAYLGGTAWKLGEAGLATSRASLAEKAISQGGTWRAAEIFTSNLMPATGKLLGAAYTYSVAERATLGGTDFSPAAAERSGGMAVGEVIPGLFGFTRGLRTPGNIYTTVRESDIAYKAALEAGRGERQFSTVTGTQEPTFKIERLTGEYIPEKLPEPSKNALLYGSVVNVKPGITRVVATDIATGEVVGAGAYRVGEVAGKPTMVVESIGSVQKGAGSSIVGEMKSIAGREGITSISGEATASAREFWGKMGAKVSEQPVGKTYPFEITGTKVFDVATGKVAGTLPFGTELTYRGKPTTSLVPEAGWGVTEPTTTGRFDWYIKQPIAQAIARPVSALKGDYAAFVQERPDLPKATTLYRGEASEISGLTPKQTSATGRWFTEDPAYAAVYGQKIYSVDVPTAKLGEYFVQERTFAGGKFKTSEYVLPESLAKAKVRYTGDTESVGAGMYKRVQSPTLEYIKYKFDYAPEEPVTIKAPQKYVPTEYGLEPISTEYGSEIIRAAYGGKVGQGKYIQPPAPEVPSLGKPVTTLKGGVWSTKYVEPTAEEVITGDVVARAYGKQQTLADIGTSALSAFRSSLSTDYALPPREWYTPAGEALRVENLNTRAIYGTEPVNMRAAAFMQERIYPAVADIRTQLIYPEMEVANINRATAVRLGDIFGEVKPAWKSSLNIFAPTPMRYGVAIERPTEATKMPTGAAEIKTKTGQSLLSRTEEVAAQRLGQVTGLETSITGLPVWPSGPSPVQKQRYVVEEETQYFTLPPGMVSPRSRIETVQTVRQVQEPTISQRQLQTQRQEAIRNFVTDIIPKQEVRQVGRQVEASHVEYATMLGSSLLLGSRSALSTQSRDMWVGITGITRQEIVTTPTTRLETRQTQAQNQEREQKPWVDRISEITKVPPPVIPGGVDLRSSGAGGGGGVGGGFKFTDILQVKSAREVLFGKTPRKKVSRNLNKYI